MSEQHQIVEGRRVCDGRSCGLAVTLFREVHFELLERSKITLKFTDRVM
jgi:hypothetical protein